MADKEKLSDFAYIKLKEMILSSKFMPGDHIEENLLCDMLNISRTPLREAINRLIHENLLVSVAHKGIFVPEMNVQNVAELFKARKLIEPMVVMLSAKRMDKTSLLAFRDKSIEYHDKKDVENLNLIDYEFHTYICSCCGNQYVLGMMQQLNDQFQRVRTQDFYPEERTEKGALEHIAMLNKLLTDQYSDLPKMMLDHISTTEKYYFKSLMANDLAKKNIDYLKNHPSLMG